MPTLRRRGRAPCALLAAPLLLLLLLPAVASAKGLFVYVHDRASPNRIHGFSLDKKTGSLELLACSPFDLPDPVPVACGGHCQTLAYAKKPKLLLASGASGVTPWRVGTDGCLELVPGSPFGAGLSDYLGLATAKRGKSTYVYVAEWDPSQVHGFRVVEGDALEGLPSSPTAAGSGPVGLVAQKSVLAGMNHCDASLSSWSIQKDGSLVEAPGSPLVHGDLNDDGEVTICDGFSFDDVFSINLSLDQKGTRLYTGDLFGSRLFGFAVDKKTAALAPFAGNPLAVGVKDTGTGMAVTKGKLVLGISSLGDIQPFARTKQALETLGPVQALTIGSPLAFALSDNQRQLVVAGNGQVSVYAVDKKTGALAEDGLGSVDPLFTHPINAQSVNGVVIVKR